MVSGRRRAGRSPMANEIGSRAGGRESWVGLALRPELLKGGSRFWTDDAPLRKGIRQTGSFPHSRPYTRKGEASEQSYETNPHRGPARSRTFRSIASRSVSETFRAKDIDGLADWPEAFSPRCPPVAILSPQQLFKRRAFDLRPHRRQVGDAAHRLIAAVAHPARRGPVSLWV